MLTLYEHPFALYCQKVLIALNEQGVAYHVLEEQRDFDRARQLYEPIAGFSNVSVALRQVDDDDRARQQLDEYLRLPPKRQRNAGVRRRWQ